MPLAWNLPELFLPISLFHRNVVRRVIAVGKYDVLLRPAHSVVVHGRPSHRRGLMFPFSSNVTTFPCTFFDRCALQAQLISTGSTCSGNLFPSGMSKSNSERPCSYSFLLLLLLFPSCGSCQSLPPKLALIIACIFGWFMTQFVFSFGTDAVSINPFLHAVISCFSPSKYFSLLLPVYVDRSLFSGFREMLCPIVVVLLVCVCGVTTTTSTSSSRRVCVCVCVCVCDAKRG